MLPTKISVVVVALAGYGLSAADAKITHPLSADEFLAKHPEMPVGRDALDRAHQGIDDSFTFTAVTQPATNVVLVQAFPEGADPEDLDLTLYSVVLVGDQKAQDFVTELQRQAPHQKTANCDGCPRKICARLSSGNAIFERASGCNQFCGSVHHCSSDWRCPSCYYVGGHCRWQKSCQNKDGL